MPEGILLLNEHAWVGNPCVVPNDPVLALSLEGVRGKESEGSALHRSDLIVTDEHLDGIVRHSDGEFERGKEFEREACGIITLKGPLAPFPSDIHIRRANWF